MNTLPALQTGALLVICAPHAARERISELAAELAMRGPLTVLDAGNRFQPYLVSKLLRQQNADVDSAARRLFVRRAFTCYQVLAMLEGTRALPQPYLVLDLLACFFDENINLAEASRLLEACLHELERLRQKAPVVISLGPALLPERECLVQRVVQRAERLIVLQEIAAPAPAQPALFKE